MEVMQRGSGPERGPLGSGRGGVRWRGAAGLGPSLWSGVVAAVRALA